MKYINKSQNVLQNLRQYWMNNVKNIKELMAYCKEKERDKKQYKACADRDDVLHYLETISEGLALTESYKAFRLDKTTAQLNEHGACFENFWLGKWVRNLLAGVLSPKFNKNGTESEFLKSTLEMKERGVA